MQLNDGIVVLTVPIPGVCRCGEHVAAGERAGFDTDRDEVVCLRCLADRKAGRTPPTRRTAPLAQPAPVVVSPSRRDPQPPRRPSTRPPGAGPRTSTSVLISLVVVALILGATAIVRSSGSFAGMRRTASDDPTAYAFLHTTSRGAPVTWDPCLPIQLVVNSASAPQGADALLLEAVERVNRASGLHLEVLGPTTQAPQAAEKRDLTSGAPGGARAPVLVAWTTPEVVPGLKGSIAGLGGGVWLPGGFFDSAKSVGGAVSLDGPQLARILRGGNGHAEVRAVVMHELGHLLGLDHVDNGAQLMQPKGGSVTEFGRGDLAGLALLGSGGCPYDTTPDSTP